MTIALQKVIQFFNVNRLILNFRHPVRISNESLYNQLKWVFFHTHTWESLTQIDSFSFKESVKEHIAPQELTDRGHVTGWETVFWETQ